MVFGVEIGLGPWKLPRVANWSSEVPMARLGGLRICAEKVLCFPFVAAFCFEVFGKLASAADSAQLAAPNI